MDHAAEDLLKVPLQEDMARIIASLPEGMSFRKLQEVLLIRYQTHLSPLQIKLVERHFKPFFHEESGKVKEVVFQDTMPRPR